MKLPGPDHAARERAYHVGHAVARMEGALTALRGGMAYVMDVSAEDCTPLLECIRTIAVVRERLLSHAPELLDDEDKVT